MRPERDSLSRAPYLRYLMAINAVRPAPAAPPTDALQRGFTIGIVVGFVFGSASAFIYLAVVTGFLRGGL